MSWEFRVGGRELFQVLVDVSYWKFKVLGFKFTKMQVVISDGCCASLNSESTVQECDATKVS